MDLFGKLHGHIQSMKVLLLLAATTASSMYGNATLTIIGRKSSETILVRQSIALLGHLGSMDLFLRLEPQRGD